MKIFHGLLIIVLLQIVHRASASFFSGKFSFNNIFGSKPVSDGDEPGIVDNAWSTVLGGLTKIATVVKGVAKETPGFIQGAWTTSTTKAKTLFNEDKWGYVKGKLKKIVYTEPPEVPEDVKSDEPKKPEATNSVFADSWHFVRNKVKYVFDGILMFTREPPGVFTSADDEDVSFTGYIKSYWSSRTGWFGSTPPGEECTEEWIPGNVRIMEYEMERLLYGQHFIIEHIPDLIRHHWQQTNPQKPLVLSLHGSTGVGKNYVSKIIVDNLFKLGDKSNFITTYSGRLEFSEERKLEEYQERLKNDLVRKMKSCERHVFIFDEVDKIPMGVLDVVKPFIDHSMKVRGQDFRKTIFIFISNMGQNEINSNYMKLWQQGVQRKDIPHSWFERILRDAVFNDKGGLRYSDNIKAHLIDAYLPFLPMQEEHVKECIRYAFRYIHQLEPTDDEIEAVHEYVDYSPPENPIFAKTGCKAINSKVALIAGLRKRRQKPSKSEL